MRFHQRWHHYVSTTKRNKHDSCTRCHPGCRQRWLRGHSGADSRNVRVAVSLNAVPDSAHLPHLIHVEENKVTGRRRSWRRLGRGGSGRATQCSTGPAAQRPLLRRLGFLLRAAQRSVLMLAAPAHRLHTVGSDTGRPLATTVAGSLAITRWTARDRPCGVNLALLCMSTEPAGSCRSDVSTRPSLPDYGAVNNLRRIHT